MPAGAQSYDEAKAAGESEPQLQLLTDITGSFRPGVLTALMGVSGAGKTTLMDVLAGRKTVGTITGDVRVNGFPKEQESFATIAGYVEQSDIHQPRTTVREALQISGLLRLHNVSRETVELFVDEVMGLVELEPLRDSIVGAPGQFGLSVEQRKRLTIAVELVANPSIVFMDEPTSGLDARAAAIVMRAVRNTVNTGRTVVCTIHQPSIDIFDAFDELLLLKRGGRTIFHGQIGTRAALLVEYFQSIPGVRPCANGINPATWMLEITALGPEQRLGVDFADLYASSKLSKHNNVLIEELATPKEGAEPTRVAGYAQPFTVQFMALMRRALNEYWRFPGYNAVRCVFSTILGLLLGSIYYQNGSHRSTANDIINIAGALFLSLVFMGYSNAAGVLPIIANARTVFYREKAANMYCVEAFALANALVEIPYVTLQAVLYSLATFFLIGFQVTAARFFWYLFFTWLLLVFFTYFGMMTVSIFPVVALAQIVNILFLNIFFLYGGFFITYPNFPIYWQWMYYLDPLSYSIEGVVASQLSMNTENITLPDGSTSTIQNFLVSYYNFKESFYPYCALIMVGFIAFFWFINMLAQKKLNFNKR
ncbi:hypothetical protein CEUSTIGMA_g1930.t1 [Chlamydomonas eustigma]|uniref:ABC transporter domain-containing protein n=1 Tax=Chlamydomonas eustigma TaxID=1157962 RepID=A0A250WUJ0_9CHLO|nr:hypothetical protein CEUSTIGMA_g1930.t1 [Chlamydomonas eustigma]|eukprot:GAX74481.1 hypothetical protein CEUSTIGMA_g1930.t1 [Chlamydomonas eustigma]